MGTQPLDLLRRRNAMFLTLIDNLDTCLVMVDEQRNIIHITPEFCEMIGLDENPDALIGASGARLAEMAAGHFADADVFLKRVAEILARRERVLGEEVPLASGRILERDYIPIFVDGTHRGHIWQYRDVTERRHAEAAMAQSRDLALEAVRVKSEFLAMMSHEIRTPMNGIIGMSELLIDTPLNETQKEYAGIIQSEARSLLRIINDILDFSKIDAGKVILDPVVFSLSENIQSVIDLVGNDARQKGLLLVINLPDDLPLLYGDGGRLRQILINLVNNAIKFTQAGSVRVDVTVVEQHDGQLVLEFVVQDTGIGIAEDKLGLLFQPFVQADSSLTRQFGGTGLGLAIVKQLVRLLGGDISVRSIENVGTRFTFTVRFALAAPDASPGAATARV